VNLLHRLDDDLLLGINTFARDTPWLHTPFLDYAKYGLVVFGLLLGLGVLLSRHADSRTLAAAGWAGVATLVAVALNQPLGHLFAEPRPYVSHPQILRLADVTADFSFPSDHATMAGAVAAGLFLVNRRLGLVALAAGLFMGFARVYVGAHYPWDVLAGFTLGASVVLLGWLVLQRPLVALTEWLRRLPGVRVAFAEQASAVAA
jgi:membrane-associated phospholipid phosphatase